MSYQSFLLVPALLVAFVGEAHADRIAEIRPVQQIFRADLIVVGKVVEIEDELVQITPSPNSAKVSYRIASIKLSEALQGAKGLTHIRVGFVPMLVNPAVPQGRPFRGFNANLAVGEEGCFFLKKMPDAEFHVRIPFAAPLQKEQANYEAELKLVKNILRIFEDPLTALKAKDLSDRQLAACALVMKYRTQPAIEGNRRVEQLAIPAEESKLIVDTLGKMKFEVFDPNGIASLQSVFWMLNLGPKDGWKPPANGGAAVMNKQFQAWAKEHGEAYRLQRFVLSSPPRK
ncbi:MAG: hypothetical protein K8T89_16420 [Planctomycetes bacterium]|nr:hypothetical protein [Planctomycetota bacterium]